MVLTNKHINTFIYSSIEIELQNFKVYKLPNGFLYLHDTAEYEEKKDESGRLEVLLIGLKYNTGKNSLNISDLNTEGDVQDALNNWTGRFTLFAFGKFYNDACGLKHIYYGRLNDIIIITSSLKLAKSKFHLQKHSLVDSLSLDHAMNWIPAPLTKYHNFYQTLPSSNVNTKLDVDHREIFYSINYLNTLPPSSIKSKINTICLYIAQEICQDKRPKFLALTGGHDSRTLFAYFRNACKDFSTILIDYPTIPIWDMIVFKRINKAYKQNSIFVKRQKKYFSKIRLEEFDSNCDYCCKDADRLFYAYNQLNQPTESLMLRANVSSEIFRRKNYVKMASSIDSPKALIEQLEKKYGKMDNFKISALELWYTMRIVNDKKNGAIDWRILFWLDQRSCAWAGSIDEAAEITNYHYLNPFNSNRLLNLFYALSVNYSEKKDFQEDLISEMNPSLLNIDFNKLDASIANKKFVRNAIRYLLRKL